MISVYAVYGKLLRIVQIGIYQLGGTACIVAEVTALKYKFRIILSCTVNNTLKSLNSSRIHTLLIVKIRKSGKCKCLIVFA